MNIPSLPVDSIYKFSAFSGLVIILFCLYTFNSLLETIQDKAVKVKVELKKTEVEIKFLKVRLERIDEIVKSKTKGIAARDILKEGKIPIEVTKDEYKTMLREFEQLFHDENMRVVEAGGLVEEMIILDRRRDLYFRYFPVFMIFGVGMSIGGFALWYRRIQRYQDQLTRNEATKNQTISF